MNSVVVRPAPGAALRAAVGAVEITAVSCAAHWIAGGMLPSVGWILASAVPVFGIGVLLHRGRLTLSTAFMAAGAGQAFLHLALAQGDAASHMDMAGSAPSATLPMVVAHLVGALATVVLWSVRRHAWDVLVRVSGVRVPFVRRSMCALVVRVGSADAWLQWMGALRRGPPAWVLH